ncbi:hypothetical protein AB0C04_15195 [Micromonospora sp. NPDC048909]|uniref:hypothetical protein n=1 Tax=Micromonospora sp. NPDC048909 TaxID=3155643 RepID=UPI0033F13CE9
MGWWNPFRRRSRHPLRRPSRGELPAPWPPGLLGLIGDQSSAGSERQAELLALLRRLASATSTHTPEPVQALGEIVRRHAPLTDDATPAAWAVWRAVPELELMANARQRCRHAESLLRTLRDRVLDGPTDPTLEIGDPDTTIADALRLEAERIGHAPVTGEGEHQVGYRAAYAGFVKQMAQRARDLEGTPERNPRRGVMAAVAPSSEPADRPTPVLAALRDSVAALPRQRDARHEQWTARVTGALEPFHATGPGLDRTALGRAIVTDLAELDRLDETLDRLERMEEQLAEAQRRVATQRAHLTKEVIRWRNTLARELRQQADHHVAATGISLDADFTAGFTLASDQIAGHLRERADRLAVPDLPEPAFPLTRARDDT